ncbi:hypothetical protein NIES3806_32700 [Microcystis aeruginosa NIES-3806]|uniref:Uncharacterized protein n=2 Tax=Microcystis aeruginosa TaxID=1126 RepID=A0A6H9GAV5_MICAE|nr:hypothetical protein NIES3787_28390 [Microcystis aeruginosa NIES-3787]GCL55914.1 hypothetical protein NIES3806_32700 [Microcystis aeruginosa NIES-3806]GCL59923.1 hypothetical protein NIES3807_31010 [Microcystis aeruginosa NIES-3807]
MFIVGFINGQGWSLFAKMLVMYVEKVSNRSFLFIYVSLLCGMAFKTVLSCFIL